jgi:hypothetical protein
MKTETLLIEGHEVTIEQDEIGWFRVTFSDRPWAMESFETIEAARKCAHDRYQPKKAKRQRGDAG